MNNATPLAAPPVASVLEPVRTRIHREMLTRLDLQQLEKMPPDALRAELQWLAGQLMDELKIALNETERRQVIEAVWKRVFVGIDSCPRWRSHHLA
ncbi:MAG: hypothetical protein E6Q48_03245 [Limnohabitans sp.]|nr:MAG: hypothetical protein E6Q48_03245 [Limnohabitans sp.]